MFLFNKSCNHRPRQVIFRGASEKVLLCLLVPFRGPFLRLAPLIPPPGQFLLAAFRGDFPPLYPLVPRPRSFSCLLAPFRGKWLPGLSYGPAHSVIFFGYWRLSFVIHWPPSLPATSPGSKLSARPFSPK